MNASKKQLLFSLLILTAALAAGAAAASLIANSIIGSMQLSQPTQQILSRQTFAPNATQVTEARRSTVTIYKKRVGSTALDKILLPDDKVGSGSVLTSDGWIMTATSALAGRDKLVVVLSDGSTSTIDSAKVVSDDATGISFVRIDAQRLTVASIGDDISLRPGDQVFAPDTLSVRPVAVLNTRDFPVATKYDLIESTEKLARRLTLGVSVPVGSSIINADGRIVGIAVDDSDAVPISAVSGLFRDLFISGKIVRPQVGARYVSLDLLVNAKNAGLPETGALITGGGKFRAVEKGSAAESAGLREGDVITSVEHDRINNEETFAERLQDYAPGSKVELTVNRNGEQIKLSLTLK